MLVATAMARGLGWNRGLLGQGLFGYNAAMVGLAWAAFFPPSSPAFLLVLPAAVLATWLHGRLLPPFARRELPVLGVPFVLVIWGAGLLFGRLGVGQLAPIIPPALAGPAAGWATPALRDMVASFVLASLPGAVAAAIGLWCVSRAALGVGLAGLSFGLGTAMLLGGLEGLLWIGGYAYTALPVALGTAGVFFPLTGRTLALAAGMSGLGVLGWVGLVWALAPLGLYPVTAMAHVLVLGLLVAAKSPSASAALGIRPRPLSEATLPGEIEAVAPAGPLPEAEIADLVRLIRRSSSIVVLSGAGMSTESGLPDYRSQTGFWYDANAEALTHARFLESASSRRLHWRLHWRFSRALERAAPNAGHAMLVELEREGKLLGVITQNVDGLHQAAGLPAERVVELHGNARAAVCLGCEARLPSASVPPQGSGRPPTCPRCGGALKVDSVSFGEALDASRLALAAWWSRSADLMLVLGTSLQVAPASNLPEMTRERGMPVVILNRTETRLDPWAALVVRGPVARVLEEVRRQLMSAPVQRMIRPMTRLDFLHLCRVVDTWWNDQVRYLLHPLYLEHFPQTCFVCEEAGEVAGFLVGFISQGRPEEAYVHLVGTAPAFRGRGIGRALYEHFFDLVRSRGCVKVVAITVPHNEGSLAFHRQMGFHFREEGAAWSGTLPLVPDYAGPGVDCVVMERKL
ncbi:MAG: urea transporter [Candidatus Rokubacteria bacterium]|nr:urea transporter [Candidatus Rokubacteria bacterium]MBI3104924.1 urea transporter [Candidatus Rokubacteria bacterium]